MKTVLLARFGAVILSLGLLPGAFVCAEASVITQFVGGTAGAATLFPGQSFTTVAGGPFDNITFNFFSDNNGGTTPSAAGVLFILSQEYLGTPSDLSISTAGFLAESTGVVGGIFQFDPTVTLQGVTQYFVYSDTSFLVSGANSDAYVGGGAYISSAAGSSYVAFAGDANFRLSGVQQAATVPAPGTLALACLSLVVLAAAQRRRKPSA
jgi:hypothetical protein